MFEVFKHILTMRGVASQLSANVATLAQQWLTWDMDNKTKAQVQAWVDADDEKSLAAAMSERIGEC